MTVNFWRPVAPMAQPVRKAPLAVCDPESVRLEDFGLSIGDFKVSRGGPLKIFKAF